MNPEKALVLAEGILSAVNAGKKKIDVRVFDPKHGILESGSRAGITVTSPKK
jgi:ASC-1-like (ASCH) protein